MEPADNKRLFIAVAISMAVLLLWQLVFVDHTQPDTSSEDAAEEAQESDAEDEASQDEKAQGDELGSGEAADPAASEKSEAGSGDKAKTPKADIPAHEEQLVTDNFTLSLTNLGGRITDFEVLDPERFHHRGNIFADLLDEGGPFPLATSFTKLEIGADTAYEMTKVDEAIVMRWANADGVKVTKRLVSHDEPFSMGYSITIENNSDHALEDTLALQLFGVNQGAGGMLDQRAPMAPRCLTEDDVEYADGDETLSFTMDIEWIGIDEAYFASLLRYDGAAAECALDGAEKGLVEAELRVDINIPAKEKKTYDFDLFIGPKESVYLESFGYGAERIIDYGWVEFLARPISWLLTKLYNLLGNWGLAIILLTIIIRGTLWPITQKSQESMMRMKEISPQLKELQAKYKNDPQVMQQKQMALFKEHNVSPFGCLPMVLQIPIWFALYRTIYVNAGLYRADFAGWLHDLSAPDPYYILPVIAGGLFFLQQKLSPNTITDPKQKVLMTIFPLVFIVVMLFLPSGLNLYILVSSIIGVSQVLYTAKKQARRTAEQQHKATSAKDKRAEKRRNKS